MYQKRTTGKNRNRADRNSVGTGEMSRESGEVYGTVITIQECHYYCGSPEYEGRPMQQSDRPFRVGHFRFRFPISTRGVTWPHSASPRASPVMGIHSSSIYKVKIQTSADAGRSVPAIQQTLHPRGERSDLVSALLPSTYVYIRTVGIPRPATPRAWPYTGVRPRATVIGSIPRPWPDPAISPFLPYRTVLPRSLPDAALALPTVFGLRRDS